MLAILYCALSCEQKRFKSGTDPWSQAANHIMKVTWSAMWREYILTTLLLQQTCHLINRAKLASAPWELNCCIHGLKCDVIMSSARKSISWENKTTCYIIEKLPCSEVMFQSICNNLNDLH